MERRLNRILLWLSVNRRWGVLLVVVCAAAMILLHDVFEGMAFWAQDRFAGDGQSPQRAWNHLVSWACLPILAVTCWWCLGGKGAMLRRPLARIYRLGTVVLAVAGYNTLFVMNIECIHFIQYAIVAILLFPLTRRFGETVFWAALMGAVDEAFQYLLLHGDRAVYFDFNDVVLNAVGAGFGVLIVEGMPVAAELHRLAGAYPVSKLLKSPALVAAAGLAAALTCLYMAGLLRLLPGESASRWTVVLRRCGPPGEFWHHTTWGKTYHELLPIEGALLALGLIAFYALLDLPIALQAGEYGTQRPSRRRASGSGPAAKRQAEGI
jgi:hypothetical protein